ncbi:MAG: acetyl-CoA carboxylase biotin carboxylase subunit [Intestinibacter sp.]|uniref:acetyl-CoA carboxylase biotin carboxylase subunit n=1 Tax=Intestinibacter sp. TaxID=1965304 RepID=UPI002A82CC67|nr:acetyl-CoA carboxylase biotin carboxylase subunit [Intestinibacter sp.]MDY4574660.1 acetyl-CoA carboxylase biotin carboxylase subunit [Intestinibacter sp.]
MFNKILIANRGEIAIRIIRTCKSLGIKTVAVYSEIDKNALHTKLADESICIGPAKSKDSYLNMNRIITAAQLTNADAIHPGFGFLSENSKFVDLCKENNITFIGPSSEVIDLMGNKSNAKNTMIKAGVPVVPGTEDPVYDAEVGKKLADEMGYPVIVKASSGGGGKGMRIIENSTEFIEGFNVAQGESVNAFADNTMYIEKYIRNPRHIEVQILADKYGNVVHLGERDCSIQRLHQKMIEESPSPAIGDELRKVLGETAVKAAKAAHYENAGTVEFLLDENGDYYFIEMNTRIQVEHPVTEMVTGIDLIKQQILIAAGQKLVYTQDDIQIKGHAIECRINAENTLKNFMPAPGKINAVHFPGGFDVRVDTALYAGYVLPATYDSMIAKVIVHGSNRKEAIEKMKVALDELVISGVETNANFQYSIMNNPTYVNGEATTGFIKDLLS